MSKAFSRLCPILALLPLSLVFGDVDNQAKSKKTVKHTQSSLKPFTGKVNGKKVRMRTSADLDSHIVCELSKDDLIVVTGEKGEFYAVEPPQEVKAYIFRSFVLDNVVEGNRVNVRLSPDREAPVVSHFNTGDHIKGDICKENNKWLEISLPRTCSFYIAKEYLEYAGTPDLKQIYDTRKSTVTKLMDSALILTQAEMRKPFHEIDIARMTQSFETIVHDYSDFPVSVRDAKIALSQVKEEYLHKKIAFLEKKTSQMALNREKNHLTEESVEYISSSFDQGERSQSERMKIWEPVEESLYLSWSSMHHAKTMDDYYLDQKLKATVKMGILEAFVEPIKQKPGDFILKDENDLPICYLYSTQVNLQEYVGKKVNLLVSKRSKNNFAFPAYYVHEVE